MTADDGATPTAPGPTTPTAPGPTTPGPEPATTRTGETPAARPLPLCPLCGVQLVSLSERCESCGGDLRLLMRVVELADQFFNRAVAAARAKRWWEAAEHLAATLALREDDLEALILLGKVRHRGKQHELAKAAWQEALRRAPDRSDVVRALDRGSRPAARSGKGRKPPR